MSLNSSVTHQLPFQIAGISGLFQTSSSSLYASLKQSVQSRSKNRSPELIIQLLPTLNVESFRLEIVNPQTAIAYLNSANSLPFYGVMTLVKALLQMLLLHREVLLLHGCLNPQGIPQLAGTEPSFFDNHSIPIIDRLVVLAKKDTHYYLANDFLKSSAKNKKKLVKKLIFATKTGAKSSLSEGLLTSNWLYFYFIHFYKKGRAVIPSPILSSLQQASVDCLKTINYNGHWMSQFT